MPKILVVEDNPLTRLTLDRFLSGEGYDVAIAEDGAQAISLLEHNQYDLVLSDVMMPNINGWDLANHLHSVLPEMPVLFMTAYAPLQSAHSSLPVAPEIVLKPLKLTELLSKIRDKLNQKKAK